MGKPLHPPDASTLRATSTTHGIGILHRAALPDVTGAREDRSAVGLDRVLRVLDRHRLTPIAGERARSDAERRLAVQGGGRARRGVLKGYYARVAVESRVCGAGVCGMGVYPSTGMRVLVVLNSPHFAVPVHAQDA